MSCVFQSLVDGICAALMENDLPAFSDLVAPGLWVQGAGAMAFQARDRKEIATLFRHKRHRLAETGASRIVRTVKDVHETGEAELRGRLRTDLLHGSMLMAPPHRGVATAIHDGARWRLSRIESCLVRKGQDAIPLMPPDSAAS